MKKRFENSSSKKALKPTFVSSFLLLAFLLALTPRAARAFSVGESSEVVDMASHRTDYRFGIGMTGGGVAGIFGLDAEVNFTESLSLNFTLGTGVDYTAVALRGRFYILARYVNPFIGFGYAKWYTGAPVPRSSDLNPRALVHDLLSDEQLAGLPANGFDLDLITPEIGIQYYSNEGFSLSASLVYLIYLSVANHTPYAEFALHWHF